MKKTTKKYFTYPSQLYACDNWPPEYAKHYLFKDMLIDGKYKFLNFEDCVFENCTFMTIFESSTFTNTLFYKCDLSNCLFNASGFINCQFASSRLSGLSFIDSTLSYTEFLDDQMRFANFTSLVLKHVIFRSTNLNQASLTDVTFSNVRLDNVDLSEGEIVRTSLKGLDIRTCKITGIRSDPSLISGMIVTEAQAIELISLLQLEIR